MTVKKVVTYEQLEKLMRKQQELFWKVKQGILDPINVLVQLQDIIDQKIISEEITSLSQLCKQEYPRRSQLIKLIYELKYCHFLDQLDFLTHKERKKINLFLNELWGNEGESFLGLFDGPESWRPIPWEEQIERQRSNYLHFDDSSIKSLIDQIGPRPKGADSRPYIIPKPFQYYQKHFGPNKGYQSRFGPDKRYTLEEFYEVSEKDVFINPCYADALFAIFLALGRIRKDFDNSLSSLRYQFGPRHLRLTKKTRLAYLIMEREIPGDYFVFWGQLGSLHDEISVRRARILFKKREFGLCPFAIAVILMTHPCIISGYYEPRISCAGSEYSVLKDGDFSAYPIFYFNNNNLNFNCCKSDYQGSSSASFFRK